MSMPIFHTLFAKRVHWQKSHYSYYCTGEECFQRFFIGVIWWHAMQNINGMMMMMAMNALYDQILKAVRELTRNHQTSNTFVVFSRWNGMTTMPSHAPSSEYHTLSSLWLKSFIDIANIWKCVQMHLAWLLSFVFSRGLFDDHGNVQNRRIYYIYDGRWVKSRLDNVFK